MFSHNGNYVSQGIPNDAACCDHIGIPLSAPVLGPTIEHRRDGAFPSPSHKILSQEGALVPMYRSDIRFPAVNIVHLIAEILQSLSDQEFPDHYRVLQKELEFQQQILALTVFAIQSYAHTPLGQNLANILNHGMGQCSVMLQELLDTVNRCRHGLNSTSVRFLWPRVFWNMGDELACQRTKLSIYQKRLCRCLQTLYSVAWKGLADVLPAGRVFFRDFHVLSNRGLPPLPHLGRIAPLPVIFCSTWEEFNCIIKGCCEDRTGTRTIQRSDYETIGNNPASSEPASAAEPGMVPKMPIILRKATAEKKAPKTDARSRSYGNNGGGQHHPIRTATQPQLWSTHSSKLFGQPQNAVASGFPPNPQNLDMRYSVINDVGRDQVTVLNHFTDIRSQCSHSVTRCSHGRLAQAAPFLTLLSSLECTYSIIDRRSYHQAQQEALGQRNELLKYYTATAVFTLPPTLLLIWVGLMKFNGRHV